MALKGKWFFDEAPGSTTAADSSGSGHHGTLVGGAAFVAGGKSGNAVKINGTGQQVTYDYPALNITGSALTIAGWIKKGLDEEFHILTKGTSAFGSTQYGFQIYGNYLLFLRNGNYNYSPLQNLPIDNTWRHIAMSWDGANVRFFLNGVFIGQKTAPGPITTVGATIPRSGFRSGSNPATVTNTFLDGIYVADNATSDADILALYNEGAAPPDTTLPVVANASINAAGDLLTINFTEAGTMTPAAAIAGFSIVGAPGRAIGNGTRASNQQFTFPITGGVAYSGEAPTLSYTPGTVADSNSNALAAFSGQAIINNSTQTIAAPTALSATPANDSQIDLAWAASATTDVTYNVYRGTAPGAQNPMPIATAIAGLTYSDTSRDPNTRYYYTIKAIKNAWASAASGEANAYTNAGAPTALVGTPGTGHVDLIWTVPTGGATSYRVYRRAGAGAFALIASPTGAMLDDTTAVNGTTYDYQVKAVGINGNESAPSNTITTTPSEAVKPTFDNASISAAGDTLTVNLTEADSPPILPGGANAITGFTLDGVAGRAIGNGTRDAAVNTRISFAISGGVVMSGETPTVSYTPGNVTDSAPIPNAMLQTLNQGVTNNSTQQPAAPVITITSCNDGAAAPYNPLPTGFTSATLEHFEPSTQQWNETDVAPLTNLEAGIHKFRWRLDPGQVIGSESTITIKNDLAIVLVATPTYGPAPLSVNANLQASGGTPPYQYLVESGSGDFPAAAGDQELVFEDPGTYLLFGKVIDTFGCVAQDAQTIVVSDDEPQCYIPPEPQVDETSISAAGFIVTAPATLPAGVTLTLQIRSDGASSYTDYATGIVASGQVTLTGLASCGWHSLRWRAVAA